MIAIIDYGLGNIRAFYTVFEHLKVNVKIASTPADLTGATKLILPGVGAFDYAMQKFNESGMRPLVEEKVLVQKMPVLGICVGLQMLANSSDEGVLPGLKWINARVRKFDPSVSPEIQLPHMGWNTIVPVQDSPLMNGIASESRYYFLHSYYFDNYQDIDSIATTNYGIPFCSAVQHENIFGVQFHPEKSHANGVQLLRNFANL